MHNNANEMNTGFNIGHDFAFYRLNRPETLSSEVIDGYYSKKERGGSTRTPDIYIRKWLNLRLHAYERGVHFSEEFTIDKIQELYVESGGICPITGLALTSATLEDSDWSIDRVINDYGYVPNNVVVMSKKANEAKGDLPLEQIKAHRDSRVDKSGLTHKQWCVLFDLMWSVNEKYEALSSNSYDEVIGVEEDADPAEFGMKLLDNITDPNSENDALSIDLFVFECSNLPCSKQKAIRRLVTSLFRKRKNNDTNLGINKLMQRSSSARKSVKFILSVLDFKRSHALYRSAIYQCQTSVREAKSALRIHKQINLSFSQRGK